jgi:hypothetical protein
MDLSHSWEVTCCLATPEFPNILQNLMVQYHVHKSPPVVPILSQINQIHTTPFYFSKISFHIILLLTCVFIVVPFLLAFPPKCYMHSSTPPFVFHVLTISFTLTLSFHLYLVKSASYELLILQFPTTYHFSLWSRYSPHHLVFEHPQSVFS